MSEPVERPVLSGPSLAMTILLVLILAALVAQWFLPTPTAPAANTKWEYQTRSYGDALQVDKMNRDGDEGWEIVAVNFSRENYQTRYDCILKRPRR